MRFRRWPVQFTPGLSCHISSSWVLGVLQHHTAKCWSVTWCLDAKVTCPWQPLVKSCLICWPTHSRTEQQSLGNVCDHTCMFAMVLWPGDILTELSSRSSVLPSRSMACPAFFLSQGLLFLKRSGSIFFEYVIVSPLHVDLSCQATRPHKRWECCTTWGHFPWTASVSAWCPRVHYHCYPCPSFFIIRCIISVPSSVVWSLSTEVLFDWIEWQDIFFSCWYFIFILQVSYFSFLAILGSYIYIYIHIYVCI